MNANINYDEIPDTSAVQGGSACGAEQPAM